jgi:hypothetical protein
VTLGAEGRDQIRSGDNGTLSTHMGKRNRRHHSDDCARDRSLLDAIAGGELDDHLTALAEAVDARRRLLLTVRSATALAVLCVGDEVRINHASARGTRPASKGPSSRSTITPQRSSCRVRLDASRPATSAARHSRSTS